MKIIELTGAPCSGKTYAISELELNLNAKICDQVWIDSILGIENRNRFFKSIYRETWLISVGLQSLGRWRSVLLMKSVLGSGWTLVRKVNVFRNVLKKYAIHQLASGSPEITFLLDEGITHLPFIFATSQKTLPEELFNYFPCGSPEVLRFHVEPKVLKSRLSERGHSLIGLRWTIDDFINANLEAEKYQDELFSKQTLPLNISVYQTDKSGSFQD